MTLNQQRRKELERILLKGIKHHRIRHPLRSYGGVTEKTNQPVMAELLAEYLDTHLPTGKRCKCGKEIRGHRRKWCSDRCQERLQGKKKKI